MLNDITFGDTVLVLSAPETEAVGIAGKKGRVYGLTTPSNTGVEVVGTLRRDHAINVFFEDLDRSVWLPQELLECVDHGAGTVISLDGVNERWVRRDDGSWAELKSPPAAGHRPWWRFWR